MWSCMLGGTNLERAGIRKSVAGWIISRSDAEAKARFLPATVMSNPHLPAETLDNIVDDLHDTKDALESCRLVFKSRVSRTQKHVFSNVAFRSPGKPRFMFPDPSISPARYTKPLFVKFPQTVTTVDAEEGG